MGICSKLVVSQEKLIIKTCYVGEIKENEVISLGNAILKRKTTQITLEFSKIELRTEKEDSWTFLKRKNRDYEKGKVVEVTLSKETKVINLEEKIKVKRRPEDRYSK